MSYNDKEVFEADTYIPGYPKGYFRGLLPPVPTQRIYQPYDEPSYDFSSNDDEELQLPLNSTVFRPVDGLAMYAFSMPWTSYPFGIPARNNPKPVAMAPPSSSVSSLSSATPHSTSPQ